MLRFEELPEINGQRWLSLEDFPGEEWRDIEQAKGAYMISNYGRVKGLERYCKNRFSSFKTRNRIRRLGYNKKGYPMISLSVDDKRVFVGAIHRLVANAFIPNPERKPQIDHINTNRLDNRVCNLRWATNKENAYNPITHEKVHRINGQKGVRHHTDEAKKKIGDAKRGEHNPWWGKFGKEHSRSKPIIQLTMSGVFVAEWECVRIAEKSLGGHIGECCRGRRQSASGYKWKFKNGNI